MFISQGNLRFVALFGIILLVMVVMIVIVVIFVIVEMTVLDVTSSVRVMVADPGIFQWLGRAM